MNRWRAALMILTLGTLWMPQPAHGADPVSSDPDLPRPLDQTLLHSLLKNPPFNRVVDYTASLLLTGVAYVEGKPLATLMDRETKKNYVVSDVPNAQGWRLAEASIGSQLRHTQIKLQVGEEMITIRYSDSLVSSGKPALSTEVKLPTDAEAIIRDSSGKVFVRSSLYLSEADRDRYRNGMSKEAHDQYRQTMRDNGEKMISLSPEQRAAFAKQVFDKVSSEDQGGKGGRAR